MSPRDDHRLNPAPFSEDRAESAAADSAHDGASEDHAESAAANSAHDGASEDRAESAAIESERLPDFTDRSRPKIHAAHGWIEWKGHRWVGLVARLYLGGLFLLACVHKIREPEAFAIDVATYQFLPQIFVNPFSISVPWIELAVGLMLIVGLRVRAAGLIVACLMLSFMLALGWALAQGLDLSCGCFASQSAKEQDPISWRTLLRDTAWLVLALYVTWFDRQPIGLEQWLSRKSNTNGS